MVPPLQVVEAGLESGRPGSASDRCHLTSARHRGWDVEDMGYHAISSYTFQCSQLRALPLKIGFRGLPPRTPWGSK